MKFICAGYPKTGSKSASVALRELGYNVADALETIEFIGPIWMDYIEGRVPIERVIEEYKKYDFDTNQDLPGNILWEDLYRAMPNDTKVILTIRDSDEDWFQSWSSFMEQGVRRQAIGNLDMQIIMMKLGMRGWMGKHMEAWYRIFDFICEKYWYKSFVHYPFSASTKIKQMNEPRTKEFMKQCYRKHNMYIINTVPKENLLIWNLKDGWEPVCHFLEKPVPQGEIPRQNKTGDSSFAKKILRNSLIIQVIRYIQSIAMETGYTNWNKLRIFSKRATRYFTLIYCLQCSN